MTEEFEKAYQKAAKSIIKGKCNILIIGKCGVGKSTLINAVFKDQLADAGVGKPVTKFIKSYSKPSVSKLTIYDTPGLEVNNLKTVKKDVFNLIKKLQKSPLEKQIHLVWYCVDEPGGRFLPEEETWIKELEKQKIKVIIVLTKAYNNEFFKYLKKQSLPEIIRVGTEPKEIIEKITKQTNKRVDTHELEKLVERTTELLPDIARESFINALSNIDFKRKSARRWLIAYAGGSFLVPFLIPIPFMSKKLSDLTVQTTMLVHFFSQFELQLQPYLIKQLVLTGIGLNLVDLSVVEILEKAANEFVENFAEEIIAGGATSLSTLVNGLAYIELLKFYKEAQLHGREISDSELIETFTKIIQEYTKPGYEILKLILNSEDDNLGWQFINP